jgi:hypothetical protein
LRNAIIIFVRHPQLGKVKTRLAASLGDEATLEIYKKLLSHTHNIVEDVIADKFVFYADEVPKHDMWDGYFKLQQLQSPDLGERMLSAFKFVFLLGYHSVCIIGSDCAALSTLVIRNALSKLSETDIVIGPATDGGYYLLGMNTLEPALFENKEWSTSTVFSETVDTIEQIGKTTTILPLLSDVDTIKDVPKDWL